MKQVTTEELKEIQDLRGELFTIISTIGEAQLSKMMLEKEVLAVSTVIEDQRKKFEEFQQKERVIYEKLQNKYGAGEIDMDTGEIKE